MVSRTGSTWHGASTYKAILNQLQLCGCTQPKSELATLSQERGRGNLLPGCGVAHTLELWLGTDRN